MNEELKKKLKELPFNKGLPINKGERTVPVTGHTCGDDPRRECAECVKVFPLQSIPMLSKSVQ